MADNEINVNALPVKTAPAAGDKMLMIGAAEEYQIDYDKLASAILDKLATKQYSELDTTAKTVLGALDELNGNINVDYVNEYKTQSYQPSQFVPFYSETLTGGLFLCVAWAEATASIDASMTLSIQGAIERAIAVRGSMLNGGGMIVTTFVDARSVPRQINFQIYNGHTTAVEIMTRANIIKLR